MLADQCSQAVVLLGCRLVCTVERRLCLNTVTSTLVVFDMKLVWIVLSSELEW